jgi:hypothetical protein
MQFFPGLLKRLLEKDFGPAIRSGFKATGLYPFNKDKVLSKFPKEQREVDTVMQRQLLKRLNDLRYKPPPTTSAKRPKNKEKLPPGASYTCPVEEEAMDNLSSSSDSSEYSEDEEEEEAERSAEVRKIVERMQKTTMYANTAHDLHDVEEEPAQGQPEEQPPQDPPEEPAGDAGDAVQAGILNSLPFFPFIFKFHILQYGTLPINNPLSHRTTFRIPMWLPCTRATGMLGRLSTRRVSRRLSRLTTTSSSASCSGPAGTSSSGHSELIC